MYVQVTMPLHMLENDYHLTNSLASEFVLELHTSRMLKCGAQNDILK